MPLLQIISCICSLILGIAGTDEFLSVEDDIRFDCIYNFKLLGCGTFIFFSFEPSNLTSYLRSFQILPEK